LYERSHILAKLHRHGESLDIFVSKLQDLKAANEYCEKYYRRNDPKSDYLFTMLFELQHAKGIKNVTDTLEYLNSHGYRMDSEFVYTVNKAVELLEHSLELPRLDSFLKQNVKSVLSLRYQEMARENLFKNYIMTVLFID
jgi:hypothetical protein